MDSAGLEIDSVSTFGTYPLGIRQQIAVNLTRKTNSKRMINIIRALGGLRQCKIADLEVYGAKMRLYPARNRSDKILLAKPHIYDLKERQALAEHLQNSHKPSFIDIGANIGAYSIFVNNLGVNAKIISIEADPETFECLQFNSPRTTNLNMAVASKEGVIPFYINKNSRGENSLIEGVGTTKIEVPAKRLVQILDDNDVWQPSALKIDVEGAEMDILGKFYEEAPRTRWPQIVLMEYFHEDEVVDLLVSKGYKELLRTKMNIVLKLS